MARPSIEPVTESNLAEFARFLHENLMRTRSPAEWEAGLRTQWMPDLPNHGFVVRDAGAIVGGIGAYYAQRQIRGNTERFCNITSWCVLDSHRQQSMRLAMALLAQTGFHFTNFSPTQVVGASLKFLKFKELDERVVVMLNLPSPLAFGARVLTDPTAIEGALTGDALKAYRDHAVFPWLRQLVVGRPGAWCHVIYKRRTYKGLPAAQLLYVSDRAVFASTFRRLAAHLLLRGMVSTHVERRLIDEPAWPSAIRTGFKPKLFQSKTLADAQVRDVYSELMSLDV